MTKKGEIRERYDRRVDGACIKFNRKEMRKEWEKLKEKNIY